MQHTSKVKQLFEDRQTGARGIGLGMQGKGVGVRGLLKWAGCAHKAVFQLPAGGLFVRLFGGDI